MDCGQRERGVRTSLRGEKCWADWKRDWKPIQFSASCLFLFFLVQIALFFLHGASLASQWRFLVRVHPADHGWRVLLSNLVKTGEKRMKKEIREKRGATIPIHYNQTAVNKNTQG